MLCANSGEVERVKTGTLRTWRRPPADMHGKVHMYEGRSISKLQIVIEKKRTEIITYKQLFFFQRNLHTNLNTCPTVSQVPGNMRRKILVVAVGTTLTLPTDSMFAFDTCSPCLELLHPIMDCLTWQAIFTVHGQHFVLHILCVHTFCPQKPHNATLFCCGTRIQGRRHLVTAVLSLLSCAYRSLRVTIKLDSAAI